MTIGGIGMQASARINHCRNPIDITFLLQSSSSGMDANGEVDPEEVTNSTQRRVVGSIISWKHTYVTSNQPESIAIPHTNQVIKHWPVQLLFYIICVNRGSDENHLKKWFLSLLAELFFPPLLKQEEKILNEPAAIYWFNEIVFVILSGFKNGLSGL